MSSPPESGPAVVVPVAGEETASTRSEPAVHEPVSNVLSKSDGPESPGLPVGSQEGTPASPHPTTPEKTPSPRTGRPAAPRAQTPEPPLHTQTQALPRDATPEPV